MLGLSGSDFLDSLLAAAARGDAAKVLQKVQGALSSGQDPARLLAQLTDACREAVYALVLGKKEASESLGPRYAGAVALGRQVGRDRGIQFLHVLEEGLQRARRTGIAGQKTMRKATLIGAHR